MTIKNANDAFDAIKDVIKRNDQEEVYSIMLNKINKVLDIKFMALGSESEVVMPAKIICRDAIMNVAAGIILVHTHPSGNTMPSTADIEQTKKIKSMLDVLDISLMDHIIVAGDKKSFYSFADDRAFNA